MSAIAPPQYQPPTASATGNLVFVAYDDELTGSDLPQGIDYDRYTGLVRPAPRGTFQDPLDLADLFDDD
jgi:hypothetical protein